MTGQNPATLLELLSAPFEANEVKFKPQSVKGNRALAICYIDARLVEDRLDEVMGIDGWKTEYTQIGPCSVECRLSLKINGEWIGKADVGSTSDQPDEGDRMKAAYSDALKRAAVLWSIGRYIYRIPNGWTDYDPVKKQFTQRPRLPDWALPKKQPARPAPAPYADPHAEPVATQHQPQQVRPTDAELKALLNAKGWTKWASAVKAINLNHQANYKPDALPADILTGHLCDFVQWLREQPNVAGAPA